MIASRCIQYTNDYITTPMQTRTRASCIRLVALPKIGRSCRRKSIKGEATKLPTVIDVAEADRIRRQAVASMHSQDNGGVGVVAAPQKREEGYSSGHFFLLLSLSNTRTHSTHTVHWSRRMVSSSHGEVRCHRGAVHRGWCGKELLFECERHTVVMRVMPRVPPSLADGQQNLNLTCQKGCTASRHALRARIRAWLCICAARTSSQTDRDHDNNDTPTTIEQLLSSLTDVHCTRLGGRTPALQATEPLPARELLYMQWHNDTRSLLCEAAGYMWDYRVVPRYFNGNNCAPWHRPPQKATTYMGVHNVHTLRGYMGKDGQHGTKGTHAPIGGVGMFCNNNRLGHPQEVNPLRVAVSANVEVFGGVRHFRSESSGYSN
ncbi:hypothetical protein EDB86DRAFT_2831594 [Lactarius hatsudake]|nr:hypothetical protein EDB86DRAFT_2831594 [Lactarius hatsudake]